MKFIQPNKYQKRLLNICFLAVNVVIIMLFTAPSILTTQYTYPVQDDFHYAYHASEVMKQGHGLLSMAIIKTIDYYKTFCGCYSSSFFGFFFSGIVNCDTVGIQLFCFLSLIFFYVAVYFLSVVTQKIIFGFQTKKSIILSTMLIICITGMLYYAEQEDFYWFITSVQYLFLLSLIFIGSGGFILSIKYHNKILAVISSLLGIIGSGAALNITAFCCILFFLIAIWGFICGDKLLAALTAVFPILGAVINVIAPGNFIRYGSPVTLSGLVKAIYLSGEYAVRRNIELIQGHPFFLFLALGMILTVIYKRIDLENHSFRYPLLITAIGFIATAMIIFPVMFGYGWDCYLIICRSNFISDIAIIFTLFFSIFYWCGWLLRKFPNMNIKASQLSCCLLVLGIGLCIYLSNCYIKGISVYRQIVEIKNKEYEEYANYWIGVYDEIEQSNDKVVTVYRPLMEDKTCLINPQFLVGEYDAKTVHGNRSIARFYHKDAVYLILE